ncbi:RHS repeat-associated core domain-containing protein [Polyangium sp. 15x6]|uniref:RHS repeat-associated core domain-containing protein n=1 Tax=Polyangium sp. 15x6 TaxID=3042687 RepID=UPI00249AD8E8|nr:RHS repeat-associated core domain-containing protein [Polyangium sp. 15x6]MDI3287316.1 DUF6531 domain-containing protein [Polyangium sp. 15x6]
MPVAARVADDIDHSNALKGLLIGAAVGLVIGIAVVATGGAALAVVATVGAAVTTGASVGEMLGSSDAVNDLVGREITGAIAKGSFNVRVNDKPAARAEKDVVTCTGTPGDPFGDHHGKRLAEGSESVLINGAHAARIGEKIECGAKICEGSPDVLIGGPTKTVLDIEDEIPTYIRVAEMVVGAAGVGVAIAKYGLKKVIREVLLEQATGLVIEEGAHALGGAIFGEGSEGQAVFRDLASTFGGRPGRPGKPTLGGPRASVSGGSKRPTGRPTSNSTKPSTNASCVRSNKTSPCGDPVDVGSGRVLDSAVDLELPGLIPFAWRRAYSSAQAHEQTALGTGGWTHCFEQWVFRDVGLTTFHDAEGRDVYFPELNPGQSSFHRSDRLLLTAMEGDVFELYSLDDRLTRVFAPIEGGEAAVLRSIRDAFGNEIALHYNANGLYRIVDTAAREIRVLSGGVDGRVSGVEIRVGGEVHDRVTYTYSSRGDLVAASDMLGNTVRYEYDIQHRIVKKTLKNGVSFYYAYDDRTDWCCRAWGDGGLHSGEIRVDLENRITYFTNAEEPRVFHWNADGLVVREETPDGILIRTCEYDRDQYLIAEGNGAGETTRHEYDARGNRVRTMDPAGNVTEYSYLDDLPTHRIGPDKLATRYGYGSKGELRQVAYPSGSQYRLEHDEQGRLISVDDGEHVVRRFGYDERHDCVVEVDARGATTQYAYDALGRAITRVDALGRMTRVEYDPLGRAVSITAPDGTVTRREHDAYGNVTQEVDALGGATEMEYSGTGKLSRMVRPDGTVWHLRYDGVERLRQILNPHGELYAFDYDTAGRVVAERTFDDRTLKYSYSDAGRVSSIAEPDGATRELRYDKLGGVLGDKTADSEIKFERDNLGRLLRAVLQERSGKVVTAFQRDELGLVAEERQNERAIQYRHDRFGRRTERVLSDGSTTRYGYGPDHELSWLEHDGRRFVLERDILGREVRRAGAAGVEIRNTYDVMDRLAERAVVGRGGHTVSSRRSWRYDELGRVVEIGDERWGTTTYRYDSIGQLLQAKRRSYCEVFHYDATGSLRKIFEGLKGPRRGKAWDTAPGNLLRRSDRAEYEYDARGRRVKKVALVDGEGARAGEVTTYRWDDRDRLREVLKASGERVLFTYDAFGRRVRKEVLPAAGEAGARVVEFVWDGDELAADLDSERGARVFVHEPGTFVPALQAEQGEVFAVVNDHLGMSKELVDKEGRVAWSAAHSAWGRVSEAHRDEAVRRGREVESPFRLLGQYADEETGLCYTRFRYFDAETGRWCSPDPLDVAGGSNLSGFDGSPISMVDPMGLQSDGSNTTTPKVSSPKRIFSARELMRRAEEPGPYHNFPEHYDQDVFERGTRTVTANFWRKPRTGMSNDAVMYSLPGVLNGKQGTFEIGVRPSASGNTEVINHRFFRPCPK